MYTPFSQANIYPSALVEKFITLLKIVTDSTSGFAQFIIHPRNWANYFNSDLVYLTGASIKSYPNYFDDYYWNNTSFPKISNESLPELSTLFKSALNSSENKIEFAFRRLYKSMMRQEEEDIIVDLIVAFEMLLTDNEKSEITHKLALRIAALLCHTMDKKYQPLQVFQNVKKIYSYRSSIVHGSHEKKIKREIKIEEGVSVSLVNLARDYLRDLLKIVISNPQCLNTEQVDRLLLVK